jgi:ABC-2 type transport system permease protein
MKNAAGPSKYCLHILFPILSWYWPNSWLVWCWLFLLCCQLLFGFYRFICLAVLSGVSIQAPPGALFLDCFFWLPSICLSEFLPRRSRNQIISFIVAMLFSFVFYLGFEFIASAGIPFILEQLFSWLSINTHNLSVSRGVVDLRDVIYFTGMTLFFLYLTAFFLRKGKWKQKRAKRNAAIFIGVLLVVFIVSANFLFRFDLTSDNRYSLSPVSREMVAGIENPVEIEIFLAGDLEPGLRKLQQEIIEKIAVLNVFSGNPSG